MHTGFVFCHHIGVCVCAYAITSKPVWSCMSKPIALVVDDSRLNGVKSPFTEQNQSLTSGEPIQSHWYVCFLSRGAVLVSKSCFKRSQTEKKKPIWHQKISNIKKKTYVTLQVVSFANHCYVSFNTTSQIRDPNGRWVWCYQVGVYNCVYKVDLPHPFNAKQKRFRYA